MTEIPPPTDILERFARIVAASVRVPAERVRPDARLDELGADSLDLVEIALDVENEFSVLMPERSILDTAVEELGKGVVEREGLLTDVGKVLLRARLPWLTDADMAGEVPVATALGWFLRVETWVALIERLSAETPRTCDACARPLEQGSPGQLRCPACAKTFDLINGDEVNRRWVREFAARVPGLRDASAP